MSRLVYNGIEISYIHTQEIRDEPQYSDDGMEYLYTKFTITVHGTINAALLPATGGSAAMTQATVRHYLETPRKTLIFYVNNDILIQSPDPDGIAGLNGLVDAKNGPFPKVLAITQIGGDQTFLVSFSVETYLQECPDGSGTPSFLSHRWRETSSIDETFYTKKIRTGKIVCQADLAINPDTLRGVIVPPIDTGFKRIRSDYILQDDGLALMYTYEDEEQYLQVPAPSVKANGHYSESSSDMAAKRYAECLVHLSGAKTTDKGALIQLAIQIAVTKCRGSGGLNNAMDPNSATLIAAAVRTELWANEVEVYMKTLLPAFPVRKLGLPMDLSRFTTAPIGSAPGTTQAPDPGTRGTASLGLIANLLNDPCLPDPSTVIYSTPPPPNQPSPPSANPEATVTFVPILPDDYSAGFSTGPYNAIGIYDTCRIDSWYDSDPQTFQLGVASSTANTTCGFVQLGAATMKRTITFEATRLGAMPIIPAPQINDPNAVLLYSKLNPGDAELTGDGVGLKFSFVGTYVYGFKDPSQVTLQACMPPWMASSYSNQMALPNSTFDGGSILNPAGTGSANGLILTGGGVGGGGSSFVGNPGGRNPLAPPQGF